MMSETPDERLIREVVEEMRDCFEQYCMSDIHQLLEKLLEDGVDKRRVLADFVEN
tara:strand:- start:202 stop:366 length:165 start_codon:yes stop_codon:yes gene_type:complete